MTGHVKVSGAWKTMKSGHVKVSGAWKDVEKGFVRVSGAWKEFYAAPVTTLTFIASATGRTSVTIPASAQAGDLAILFTAAHGLSIAKVFPADFTEVRADHDTDDSRMVSGYKILTSGDPGSSKSGMNDNEDAIGVLIFRPNRPINSQTVSIVNGEATISNPTAQTVSASILTGPLVVVAFRSSTNTISPITNTPSGVLTNIQMTNGGGEGNETVMSYVKYDKADTPVNITVDMDDEGDNVMQSWAIVVA